MEDSINANSLRTQVDYLGFEVSQRRNSRTSPAEGEGSFGLAAVAIRTQDIRSFLGLASHIIVNSFVGSRTAGKVA